VIDPFLPSMTVTHEELEKCQNFSAEITEEHGESGPPRVLILDSYREFYPPIM
jgi:hypothetical protein